MTLRQLQWWDERGVVSPEQKGHRRFYRPRDVLEILVISELRRKGLSFQKTRWALTTLRRELDGRVKRGSHDVELYLVTDLNAIQLEDRMDRVIEFSKRAERPVYVVSIGDQVRLLAPEKAPGKQLRLF